MKHKRGDSFDYVVVIPDAFHDGYFVGWSVKAQLRNKATGGLVAQFDTSWENEATTRRLRLFKINTKTWPIADLEFDVQFTRDADGYTISSNTVDVKVIKDITSA